jgi:sodium transport system ATP-binding protein
MLKVTDVHKSFPQKKGMVLSGLTFSINRGESVALVGENGAGKTTLIRILSLILSPDTGAVSLDGTDSRMDPEYIKSKTGTLFSGDGALYDRLSARENIIYYARLNGILESACVQRLEMLSEELSLSGFLDDRVSTFSRGMKQRTALARALITDPDFVILDEPSTGLDIIASGSVKRIIARLKEGGKTILFSSHNADEIFSCSDRIIILHKGRITCDKSTRSFSSKKGNDLTSYIKE